MCALPVAAPSSVCALVVEPVGLLFVAYVAVSFVCSILCAVGSTLLAVYLISHIHTGNKINLCYCYTYSSVAMVKCIHGNSNFSVEFIISMCILCVCVCVRSLKQEYMYFKACIFTNVYSYVQCKCVCVCPCVYLCVYICACVLPSSSCSIVCSLFLSDSTSSFACLSNTCKATV